MEVKKTSTNSRLASYLGIGAIGIAALGLSYYLLRKRRKSNSEIANISTLKENRLPKELLIKILKEIRKEIYPVFLYIEQISEKLGYTNLNPEQKKEVDSNKHFSG